MIPWPELSAAIMPWGYQDPRRGARLGQGPGAPRPGGVFSEGDADGDGAKMREHVIYCGPPALPAPPDIVGTPCQQREHGVLAVMKPGATKPEQCHLADLQCRAYCQLSAEVPCPAATGAIPGPLACAPQNT